MKELLFPDDMALVAYWSEKLQRLIFEHEIVKVENKCEGNQGF